MNSKMVTFSLMFLPLAAAAVPDELAQYGGEIRIWPKDPGIFYVVDAQMLAPHAVVNESVKNLTDFLPFDIRSIRGSTPKIENVANTIDSMNAKGAIWIVDSASLPIVLAATENGWGVLNVRPLWADGADANVKSTRLKRMIFRLFGYINGVSSPSVVPACVFQPAHGIAGLDELACTDISPESFSKIEKYLLGAGYKQAWVGTYYDACEEGLASPPTNAVQKAIWDKVHALPKAPIKIKPETKKVAK